MLTLQKTPCSKEALNQFSGFLHKVDSNNGFEDFMKEMEAKQNEAKTCFYPSFFYMERDRR